MKFLIYGAALLVAATPVAAIANPLVKDQLEVRYNDLNLQSVDGQRQLAIRLVNAAEAVCGDRVDTLHVMAGRKARDCMSQVVVDAQRQIMAHNMNSQSQLALLGK